MCFWWKAAAKLRLHIRTVMDRGRGSSSSQVRNSPARGNSGRLLQKSPKIVCKRRPIAPDCNYGAPIVSTFVTSTFRADGSLAAFIPDPDLAQVDVNRISGASGIVADDKGTIYAADVGPHRLRKYVKVK
jgi:hypothetical protein